MARTPLPLLLLLLLTIAPALLSYCEDIPLESCDRLPVVQVRISGTKFLFLVDTAATSTLNLVSFGHGDPTRAAISSWTGTTEAKAQDVLIGDLAIGLHHLKNVHLMAVDLSAIGRACGRQIDGILGLDLLAKLGLTVDLKNHTARFPADAESSQSRIAELENQLSGCDAAFNRGDEAAFAQCLDPQVVMFAVGGDFYGRDAAMQYYRDHYFHHDPPARLELTPRAHHLIGDAIWMEYDLRITVGSRVIQARGTALCAKADGQWRIVHMNHSSPPGGRALEQ
jgi:ketosteroid isomerase-like protein